MHAAAFVEPAGSGVLDGDAKHERIVRRFVKHVGDPPAGYLTRLRMDVAARRLRDTDDPIETIARSVGYESVYAFSRAFARERALPPGRYRTQSREASAAG
jgi:transcriptional regulator GlxA family with amidase domain